jgi:hypothetical protein
MSNILEVPQQQAIQALIVKGWSVRHIARTLGINRRTVKRYADAAPKCTTQVIAGSVPPDAPKCTTFWGQSPLNHISLGSSLGSVPAKSHYLLSIIFIVAY